MKGGRIPAWVAQWRKLTLRNTRITSPLCFLLFVRVVPRSLIRLRNPSPLRKMFKRIEKKLARKKEEEELGITEEIKEAIGLNDLDSSSDESEASSFSSSPKISSKRKRLLDDDDELDASSDGQGSGASGGPEDDDDDDDYEVGVQMTIEEALHNPLFIVSIQPDVRGCIVCPHKLLKNDAMVSVHTKSQVRYVPRCANIPRVVMEISRLLFPYCSVGTSATDVQVYGGDQICQTR